MPVNSSISGVKHNAKMQSGKVINSGKFFAETLSHSQNAMMWMEMVRVIILKYQSP
jgi:hypothetical protein